MDPAETPKKSGGPRTKGELSASSKKARDGGVKGIKHAWGVDEFIDIFPPGTRPSSDLGLSAVAGLRALSSLVPDLVKAKQLMLKHCKDKNGATVPISFKHITNMVDEIKAILDITGGGPTQRKRKAAESPADAGNGEQKPARSDATTAAKAPAVKKQKKQKKEQETTGSGVGSSGTTASASENVQVQGSGENNKEIQAEVLANDPTSLADGAQEHGEEKHVYEPVDEGTQGKGSATDGQYNDSDATTQIASENGSTADDAVAKRNSMEAMANTTLEFLKQMDAPAQEFYDILTAMGYPPSAPSAVAATPTPMPQAEEKATATKPAPAQRVKKQSGMSGGGASVENGKEVLTPASAFMAKNTGKNGGEPYPEKLVDPGQVKKNAFGGKGKSAATNCKAITAAEGTADSGGVKNEEAAKDKTV